MIENRKEKINVHNFNVISRYVVPIGFVFAFLSCFLHYFHFHDASMITVKIAVAFGLILPISKVVLRFLPERIKLPGKPISTTEWIAYIILSIGLLFITLSIESPSIF